MFCPNCEHYVERKNILKRNIKGVGNADIEYDAICPYCMKEVGHVFWGRLQQPRTPQPGRQQAAGQAAANRRGELRTADPVPEMAQTMVEEAPRLPSQDGADRRHGDRRTGTDRRKRQVVPWLKEERRQVDRRQGERRKGERRKGARNDRRASRKPMLFERRSFSSDRRKSGTPNVDWKI